ncbi:MAG: phosphate acyltransferase PlsX [bacterium]
MASEKLHKIVLDVMGADGGEECIVDGGLEAARKHPDSLHMILVGRRDRIEAVLNTKEDVPANISIEHAPDVVSMQMSATDGVRARQSSIHIGLKLVKAGQAEAFVSPGNTGAVMATSLLTLGRIEGVSRPAIASAFPTSTGNPTLVLDCGANADCKPAHISQFAIMGSVFAQVIFNRESPRVGLISIGEERSKGNELIFNSRRLLKDSDINFVGNIEGRDILSGMVDVAVTDGFTGNILLKFAESIKPMMVSAMQRQIQTNIFSRMGAVLLLPFLKRMRNRFDYAESGGAPLLGVNGAVIICHGSSNARAIGNAVGVAYGMVRCRMVDRIREELVTNHLGYFNGTKAKGSNNRNGVVYSTEANDER